MKKTKGVPFYETLRSFDVSVDKSYKIPKRSLYIAQYKWLKSQGVDVRAKTKAKATSFCLWVPHPCMDHCVQVLKHDQPSLVTKSNCLRKLYTGLWMWTEAYSCSILVATLYKWNSNSVNNCNNEAQSIINILISSINIKRKC